PAARRPAGESRGADRRGQGQPGGEEAGAVRGDGAGTRWGDLDGRPAGALTEAPVPAGAIGGAPAPKRNSAPGAQVVALDLVAGRLPLEVVRHACQHATGIHRQHVGVGGDLLDGAGVERAALVQVDRLERGGEGGVDGLGGIEGVLGAGHEVDVHDGAGVVDRARAPRAEVQRDLTGGEALAHDVVLPAVPLQVGADADLLEVPLDGLRHLLVAVAVDVDGEPVGVAGLGQELLGALGVVLVHHGRFRIAAELDRVAGRVDLAAVTAQQHVDDLVARDGVGDGLAYARVGEERLAATTERVHLHEPDPQDVGGVDAGAAADGRRLVGADGARAGDVDVAGHERSDARGLLGQGVDDEVGDGRHLLGADEVVVEAFEADGVAVHADEAVRAGADRRLAEGHGAFGREYAGRIDDADQGKRLVRRGRDA